MANSSQFSFDDVVLVPFPFTDQAGTKKRPAGVISSHGYNASRRDITRARGHNGRGVKSCIAQTKARKMESGLAG